MLETTLQIIRSALKGDPTVSVTDRPKIIAAVRGGAQAAKAEPDELTSSNVQRIVRRREAAQMYGCSLRLIDRLASQGFLRRVRLPGRKRASGFLASELLTLIAGNEVEAA